MMANFRWRKSIIIDDENFNKIMNYVIFSLFVRITIIELADYSPRSIITIGHPLVIILANYRLPTSS